MPAAVKNAVESIFVAIIAMPPDERAAGIQRLCDGNADLQREVEGLLRFHETSRGGALDRSPLLALTGAPTALHEERLPANSTAAGFTLKSVLGSGGMGVVYVAEQHKPLRRVALKVIRPTSATAEMLRRFEHEAQLLARLQHPGIAQVYETGVADFGQGGQPFIAMELIEGPNLLAFARQHALTISEKLELVARVCEAVQHAHQRGVIHRDLKPANILVLEGQSTIGSAERLKPVSLNGQPKILDFGVGRATDADQAATMQTSAGQLIGTLAYMSPEQVAADPDGVDTRADVYALGVILYQLLSDRLPHDLAGKSVPEAARIIRDEQPQRLSALPGVTGRHVRGDVETILSKALEKEPARRYQSASDLAADIRRYLGDEPILARPATSMYQFRKFVRRNKALTTGAAVAFAALTLGLIVSVTQKVEADRATKQAQAQGELAKARLADAEAVRDFLRDMFSAVDPRANGRDVRVIDVLKAAAAKVDRGFADQPAIEASLHDALGVAYLSLAMHDEAEPHLTRSLALCRGMYDGDHIDTARGLHSVGSLRLAQGNFAAAKTLFEDATSMRRRLFGDSHRAVAESLNAQGLVHRAMGELDQADDCFRRTIAMLSELFGPDDLLVMAYNDDLARLLFARGKYDEAAALHKKSVEVRRRELGNDHPDVALSLNHFAQTQFVKRDYEGAERSLREALQINRRAMGERHTAIADSLSNLAVLRRAQRDLDEAENLVRQALDMRRGLLGDDHQDVATTLNELANIVRDRGNPQDAEGLYRQALETYRRSAGGEDNPFTAVALNNLADVLATLNRDEEAESAFREAAAIRRSKLPPGHPQIAEALYGLGALLMKAQRCSEAEPVLREAVDIRRAALGPEAIQTAFAESALGECLGRLQRFEEGESALRHSFAVVEKERGSEHAHTAQVRQRLANLYSAWGKPVQAAALQPTTAPASVTP